MKTRKMMAVVLLAGSAASTWSQVCDAQSQCCLSNLFTGCGSCFRKAPPAYAVAPVHRSLQPLRCQLWCRCSK